MKHLDLFSGIGGFALAAEMAWEGEDVEHTFCDNEPFAQAVLKKHWPNSRIYGDIKEITAERIAADTHYIGWEGQDVLQQGRPGTGRGGTAIDLLTGGFPCQPFSAAGRRRGTEDDRHLWPEMLRVIREVRPTYVLGENVGGFLTWDGGMVFEQVCTDLEAEGYEVCPLVIPACAVNAPHRRDRVWIAAHAIGSDAIGTPGQLHGSEGEERLQERHQMGQLGEPGGTRVPSDPEYARFDGTQDREGGATGSDGDPSGTHQDEQSARPVVARDTSSHAIGAGAGSEGGEVADEGWGASESGTESLRQRDRSIGAGGIVPTGRDAWNEDWPALAARLCTLDDGLPDGLARPRGWRNAALKGAGNAIVPQVAAEILRAMRNRI